METAEGNKLIAEFMGLWAIERISALHYTVNGQNWQLLEEPPDYKQYFFDKFCNPKNTGAVKYHESWDWLMPVVEKIENCCEFDEFGFSFSIDNWQVVIKSCLSGEPVVSRLSQDNSKIDAVWRSVVQFIKWYNTSKEK